MAAAASGVKCVARLSVSGKWSALSFSLSSPSGAVLSLSFGCKQAQGGRVRLLPTLPGSKRSLRTRDRGGRSGGGAFRPRGKRECVRSFPPLWNIPSRQSELGRGLGVAGTARKGGGGTRGAKRRRGDREKEREAVFFPCRGRTTAWTAAVQLPASASPPPPSTTTSPPFSLSEMLEGGMGEGGAHSHKSGHQRKGRRRHLMWRIQHYVEREEEENERLR